VKARNPQELGRARSLGLPLQGFLQLPMRTPALRTLHVWLDSWTGIGVIIGMERQGFERPQRCG